MRNQFFHAASQRNAPLNGTPIRGRQQNFKNFNSVRQPYNKQNGDIVRNISPNAMNNTRKLTTNMMPVAQYSPRNQSNVFHKFSQPSLRCVTHAMKHAEYQIQVEGDIYDYCQSCAIHLVNQGFNAQKIGQSSNVSIGSGKKSLMFRQGSKKNYGYQPRQLPYYPEFQSNKNYHEILQFLRFLYSVEQNHFRNIEQFQTFQSKFEQQISATEEYYDSLLQIITQMRQDHLDDLYQETQRYTQIAQIQIGHVRDNLTQIDSIREDIENNLQAIITKVDAQNFQNCVEYYRQRAYVYKLNVQQQEDTFKQVEKFTNHDIKQKIDRVIEFLKDVWKEPDFQSKQTIKENFSPTHFAMKVHERLPSSNSQRKLNSKQNDHIQGQYIQTYQVETQKPACRSLFNAEQSSQAVASPQFKNF